MRRDSSSPQAYLRDVKGEQRDLLEALRELVFQAAPDLEEGIRYGMLDYPGLANLAAQKEYVALYVAPEVLARRKADFAGIDCGKGCVRFRRLEQLDRRAVSALLRAVRAFRQEAGRAR